MRLEVSHEKNREATKKGMKIFMSLFENFNNLSEEDIKALIQSASNEEEVSFYLTLLELKEEDTHHCDDDCGCGHDHEHHHHDHEDIDVLEAMGISQAEFFGDDHAEVEKRWLENEKIIAPLRTAKNFVLKVEDWNMVSEVGLPDYDDWCFIVTPSQHGCYYDWGVAGYNKEAKTFYVNYGMGGLVYDESDVIAWKPFTNFKDIDEDTESELPQFIFPVE